jgi:FMN phosphatase YigB (HAD superfamily)
MRAAAVSFDLGQTLLELDEVFLAERAQQRGLWIDERRVTQEQPRAWQAYDAAKANGKTGFGAWSAFVCALLTRAGLCTLERRIPVDDEQIEVFVRYLWSEQPKHNLWRRPVAGMLDLVRLLAERGIKVGVLTNSEGRARELIDATGFGAFVSAVVDSGIEGIEKPDPRIFASIAARLCSAPADIVHVGDSYEADVLGALSAGMTPIWFLRGTTVAPPAGVLLCRNAGELAALLLAD